MSRTTDDLRDELLRRAELDQSARSSLDEADEQLAARLLDIDAENTAWLKRVVRQRGWPTRSLVGDAAAHAAWLLAQHADRDPRFQRQCLELLSHAVAEGEASAIDLAYLTDRTLVNSGRAQIYGTQLTVQDGQFAPQRLKDAASVDARRASVDLEPLADYLHLALAQYGPPKPTAVLCRACSAPVPVWLPAPGQTTTTDCPACGSCFTVRGYAPGARVPLGAHKISPADLGAA